MKFIKLKGLILPWKLANVYININEVVTVEEDVTDYKGKDLDVFYISFKNGSYYNVVRDSESIQKIGLL